MTTLTPPSPPGEGKTMVVMPKGLATPATPTDVSGSLTILRDTLAALTPLLDVKAGSLAAGAVPTVVFTTPTEAFVPKGPFDGIAVQDEYLRPNGEVYKPRMMSIDGKTVQDVTFVRSAARAGKPVLLYGPPGTGKTALIEAALPDCLTVQGTIETERADFVGSWVQEHDGTYRWIDRPLVQAADTGKGLLIDEIALIDPRSLAVVYGAMDGRNEIDVAENPKRGKVKVQPGFIVMGAFNPNVPGAILSDALLSRFPIQIEMLTDWSLATKLGVPAKIIQVVRNLNHKVETGEMTAAPQLRELLNYRDLVSQFGEQFALSNFLGQIRPENRAAAVGVIKAVMGGEDPKALTL